MIERDLEHVQAAIRVLEALAREIDGNRLRVTVRYSEYFTLRDALNALHCVVNRERFPQLYKE